MKRKLLSILVLLLFVSGAYAQSTLTVYVKNEAGWENTYIFYWDDEGDNGFPGTPMDDFYTDDLGYKFYKKTISIPNGVSGILFTDGSFSKMTDNITLNIADGALWIITDAQDSSGKYIVNGPGIYSVTLNDTDDPSVIGGLIGQTHGVTMTRTLQKGGWNTFCAPFNISSSQITSVFGAGTRMRELGSSSYDEGTKVLTLNFTEATSIEAGKPYLVYLGSGSNVVNPTFEGVTISNSTTTKATTYVDFVPVINRTQVTADPDNVLFLGAGNTLLHPSAANQYMNGFRAYFLLTGGAAGVKEFNLDFGEGETTGISLTSDLSPMSEGSVYDMSGRLISNGQQPMAKGLYIVNGKKVIIK